MRPEAGSGKLEAVGSDVVSVLTWAEKDLTAAGVASARVDAEYLLAHVLSLDRLDVLLGPQRPIQRKERVRFGAVVGRRVKREPLQYITGEAAFRNLVLQVTPDVLIPRPETECVAGVAIDFLRERRRPRLLDVGTGSGAIALAVAQEVPDADVVAIDISAKALAVARANAARLRLAGRVRFVQSDLFAGLAAAEEGSFDVVVSNPPYVSRADAGGLEPEVLAFEPVIALFGVSDPFAVAREIARQAPHYLKTGGCLILEIAAGAGERVSAMIGELAMYGDVEVLPDLAGRDRILRACKLG